MLYSMSERRPQSELADESTEPPTNDPGGTGARAESTPSEVAEQRVPEPPGLDAVERRQQFDLRSAVRRATGYDDPELDPKRLQQEALASLRSLSTTDPSDVYRVLTALRELISEVRRDVRALENAVDSKIEALKSAVNAKIDALMSIMDARIAASEKSADARHDALEKIVDARHEASEKSADARFEATEKSIASLRWMIAILITLVIALIALVVGSLFFFRSSL